MSDDNPRAEKQKPSRETRSMAVVAGVVIGLLLVIGMIVLLTRPHGA